MTEYRNGGCSHKESPATTVLPDANIDNISLIDRLLHVNISSIEKVASGKITGSTTLCEWLRATQSGQYREQIEAIRNADKQTAGTLKKGLPAITVSGLFKQLKADPVQHSGVLCVDIDVKEKENPHLLDTEALQHLKEQLQQDNTVIAYSTSASGRGLAVYVAIDPEQHLNSFLTIERDYLSKYGVVIDKNCKNVNRTRGASYDPGTYIASEVQRYAVKADPIRAHYDDPESITLTPAELQGATIQAQRVTAEYLKRASDPNIIAFFDNYNSWLLTMFSLSQLGEAGREMAHKLSQIAPGKYNERATNKAFNEGLKTENRGLKRNINSFFYDAQQMGIVCNPIREQIDYTKKIESIVFASDTYEEEQTIKGYYLAPEHLPHCSAWINKGATGNGATSSFIADETRGIRVLCVPYRTIIEAKVKGKTNVIPVAGKMSVNEIKENFYSIVANNETPVIVGTYDSLKKIAKALAVVADLKEVALMVDESHHLTEDFGYRSKAITTVLECCNLFKYCLCISATPVPYELIPEELKGFQRIKYNFPDIQKTAVLNKELTRPADGLIRKLRKIAKNDKFRNNEYHIFVNSVRTMKRIYNELNKVGVVARCVYSKGNKEAVAIDSLPNSGITSAPAQFNIYTSCAYDGIDIHISDEDYKAGKRAFIFLVSSGSQTTMQTNIFTQLIQVSGRIRLTPEQRKAGARASITHYYNKSKSKAVSKYLHAKELSNDLHQLKEIAGASADNCFIARILPDYVINGRITTIPLMNDLFKCLISSLYCSDGRISEAMHRYGLEVTEREREEVEAMEEEKPKKKHFTEIVKGLLHARENGELFRKEHAHDLAQFESSVGRSFEYCMQVLSPEEMQAERPNHLKAKLITKADIPDRTKIYYLLRQRIIIGQTYTGEKLKGILSEVYKSIGITKTVKLTSLSFYWCELQECRKDIVKDGKIIKGKGGKAYKAKKWSAVAPDEETAALIGLTA